MTVRSPAVAGRFYPARPRRLAADVDGHLSAAASSERERPKVIVAPHAGYVFSGPIAGTAYAPLVGATGISRVVILGPAHTVALRGIAATTATSWDGPLGAVPIDRDTCQALAARFDFVHLDDRPHTSEHGIEVHVPFLQRALADPFELVPLVVGETTADEVAHLLDACWGGPETLVVVSTDLSHYLDHEAAVRRDTRTCEAVERLDPDALDHGDACGFFPLRGLLVAAARRGLDLTLLDRRTSADTAGDPDRVVGYAAFVSGEERTDQSRGRASATRDRSRGESSVARFTPLTDVAVRAVAARLGGHDPPPIDVDDALLEPGAAFVSLHDGDRLLGCIGTLEPRRPLAEEVADKAIAAAFADPRLPPLTPDEFERMEVAVSVLGPSEPIDVAGYDELVASIGPGDGLTVTAGRRRATLLPSMWDQLPDPEWFLDALWRKAGLRPRAWPRGIRVERYRSLEVVDRGPRPPAASYDPSR